jgi:hypothetical protein
MITKEAANYRPAGFPLFQQCGSPCIMFEDSGGAIFPSSCTLVEGEIWYDYVCDYWAPCSDDGGP